MGEGSDKLMKNRKLEKEIADALAGISKDFERLKLDPKAVEKIARYAISVSAQPKKKQLEIIKTLPTEADIRRTEYLKLVSSPIKEKASSDRTYNLTPAQYRELLRRLNGVKRTEGALQTLEGRMQLYRVPVLQTLEVRYPPKPYKIRGPSGEAATVREWTGNPFTGKGGTVEIYGIKDPRIHKVLKAMGIKPAKAETTGEVLKSLADSYRKTYNSLPRSEQLKLDKDLTVILKDYEKALRQYQGKKQKR